MNSHEVFIHIHQGCFAGTGAIVRLPQCQWSKPDGYGKISQCITTTKHSKAKTMCIFLRIYCNRTLGANFREISIKTHRFSFNKKYLTMSAAKWRLFCLGLSALTFLAVSAKWPLGLRTEQTARRIYLTLEDLHCVRPGQVDKSQWIVGKNLTTHICYWFDMCIYGRSSLCTVTITHLNIARY